MGCICSKPQPTKSQGVEINVEERQQAPSVATPPSASLPPPGAFRHTHDLRVGVLESKDTSVTLLNDYVVLGALGRGAFGSVKLCFSMADNSLYALKVLQRAQLKRQMLGKGRRAGGSSTEQAALDELRREVDVMRVMNHPNLIKIFEVIEAQSKVVMVLEYAEAGPLAQPDQRMPEPLAQYYFRQIVAGLECLHSQSVVHGDIKPDNVLLSGSGLVKIADFGQAQFFDQGTDVFDKTLGTPAFMAPEVRSGGAYHGMPADMWALGVTLYHFLFGDLPFKGDTLDELYEAICTQEVQYPSDVPISADLRSVLDGLLSKDPGKRPTSAQLMHHPWVADEAGRGPEGSDAGLGIERLDDVPSMESWIRELAAEEQLQTTTHEPAELPMVQEVAASVFGQPIMTGTLPLTTSGIMDAIADTSAPLGSSARSEAVAAFQARSAQSIVVRYPNDGQHAQHAGSQQQPAQQAEQALSQQQGGAAAASAGATPAACGCVGVPAEIAERWQMGSVPGLLPSQDEQMRGVVSMATLITCEERLGAAGSGTDAPGDGSQQQGDAAVLDSAAPRVLPDQAQQGQEGQQVQQSQRDGLGGLQEADAATMQAAVPCGAAGSAAAAVEPAGVGPQADPHQVAVALNNLLNSIGDELAAAGRRGVVGLAAVGKQLTPPWLRTGGGGDAEGEKPGPQRAQHAATAATEQQPAAERVPAPLPSQPTGGPAATSGLSHGGYSSLPIPSPFESGAFDPSPVSARALSHHASLPAGQAGAGAATPASAPSPFASQAGGGAEQNLASRPSQRTSFTAPPGGGLPTPVGFSTPARVSVLSRSAGAGAPVLHTMDLWAGVRQRVADKPVEGVKFVNLPAGTTIEIDRTRGGVCLLVESGLVDVRYVATLPLHQLSKHRQQQREQLAGESRSSARSDGRGAAAAGAASRLARRSRLFGRWSSGQVGGGDDDGSSSEEEGSEEEERRFDRRDSIARGPDAQAVKGRHSGRAPGLEPSPSLQVTVDRVLARAQQILESAANNSDTNLLTGMRGPNDFVGIQYLLDPSQLLGLSERWRPVLVARTNVQGVLLTRPAVELVLKHYPLAQVYLRITLSKGRAELLQLHTLENIASCMRPARGAADAGAASFAIPGLNISNLRLNSRLDLFRAVSFARRLAEQVADQLVK